jgi:hypothetical protein
VRVGAGRRHDKHHTARAVVCRCVCCVFNIINGIANSIAAARALS